MVKQDNEGVVVGINNKGSDFPSSVIDNASGVIGKFSAKVPFSFPLLIDVWLVISSAGLFARR